MSFWSTKCRKWATFNQNDHFYYNLQQNVTIMQFLHFTPSIYGKRPLPTSSTLFPSCGKSWLCIRQWWYCHSALVLVSLCRLIVGNIMLHHIKYLYVKYQRSNKCNVTKIEFSTSQLRKEKEQSCWLANRSFRSIILGFITTHRP